MLEETREVCKERKQSHGRNRKGVEWCNIEVKDLIKISVQYLMNTYKINKELKELYKRKLYKRKCQDVKKKVQQSKKEVNKNKVQGYLAALKRE